MATNQTRSDDFTNELMALMQDTDPNGDFYTFGGMGDCENVGNIPRSFLVKHYIPLPPPERAYLCTAYGDLFAYKTGDQSIPDRGVGFNWDTWTWSL